MPTAAVLGAGMVGSVIARDLAGAGEFSVALVDARDAALAKAQARAPAIKTRQADLRSASELRAAAKGADVVVGALSSAIGYAALEQLVEMGCAVVDISFFAQDAQALDDRARATGARVIFDMGVAPGMSNVLSAEAVGALETCERLDIAVGGVPRDPQPPWFYKAAFAPADVLEEYTRPARVIEGGAMVKRPALSDEETIEFAGFGSYSAFLTDGLRSLATTLAVPSMREKTLRDPRHLPLVRALRDGGFLSKELLDLPGEERVRPIDATSALLFPHWTYDEGEADLTLMRIAARGRRSGAAATIVWELADEYDAATATTSMARTTAFPAAVAARLLVEGAIDAAGVHPPETLARAPGALERLLAEQRDRGVVYTRREVSA